MFAGVEDDNSKNEFPNLLSLTKKHCKMFEGFNKHPQRLDSFLAEFIVPNLGQYKHMWRIFVFIFTLCHGQDQVERGFNINKKTLQENLQKKSLVGGRIVYDTLNNCGKSGHDFVITNGLILSCKSTYSKYINELTKKKENITTIRNNKKRKSFFKQITESKHQKMSLENCNEKMEKDTDKYLTDAEENKDIQLLATGYKLRKAV